MAGPGDRKKNYRLPVAIYHADNSITRLLPKPDGPVAGQSS